MNPSSEEVHVGRRLYDGGWRQGTLLRPSGATFRYGIAGAEGDVAEQGERPVKSKELLIVASQDCDIIAKSEPYVEALVCKKESADFCARLVQGNSSRWFLLDEGYGIVANAPYKIIIKKEALEGVTPEEWSLHNETLTRFARWLARRYTRPAFPDEFVEVFQAPINGVFETGESEKLADFSRAVSEIRISKTSLLGPPYSIDFLFITVQEEISESEGEAITYVQEAINAALTSLEHVESVEFNLRTLDETSMSEFFSTEPIYLEYLTYSGISEYSEAAEPSSQT